MSEKNILQAGVSKSAARKVHDKLPTFNPFNYNDQCNPNQYLFVSTIFEFFVISFQFTRKWQTNIIYGTWTFYC
jgi:hypothetical protein